MTDAAVGVRESFAIAQSLPLAATTGRTLATFDANQAAVVATALGKGQLISYGFWPGVTYWLSPDRQRCEAFFLEKIGVSVAEQM